jgi:hypothetical protein
LSLVEEQSDEDDEPVNAPRTPAHDEEDFEEDPEAEEDNDEAILEIEEDDIVETPTPVQGMFTSYNGA